MRRADKPNRRGAKSNRKGVPLIVYLKEDQASKLNELSRERRVTKTALVQFAVDKLFTDLSGGQLELPLGLGAR